jgi:hypothetical protein
LVEQGPFKALVLGSSPSRPTIPTFPATSSDVCDFREKLIKIAS